MHLSCYHACYHAQLGCHIAITPIRQLSPIKQLSSSYQAGRAAGQRGGRAAGRQGGRAGRRHGGTAGSAAGRQDGSAGRHRAAQGGSEAINKQLSRSYHAPLMLSLMLSRTTGLSHSYHTYQAAITHHAAIKQLSIRQDSRAAGRQGGRAGQQGSRVGGRAAGQQGGHGHNVPTRGGVGWGWWWCVGGSVGKSRSL